MSVEQVLVIPTTVLHEAGLFQGLSQRVEHYLPRLLEPSHLSFLPRPQAEEDPSFKQIIPYVVLRHGDNVFHYTRGKGGGEKRLAALRSLGVGGHINPIDHAPVARDSVAEYLDVYRQGMLRELHEEVYLETGYRERCLGLINDDSLPVGRVHLGIVHVFDLDEPRVRRREENLDADGFSPLTALWHKREQFETWSQFVLEALVLAV